MADFAPANACQARTRFGQLGCVAIMLALQCSPVLAVDVDDAAKSNVASSPQAEVLWISGGVGDEAMTEMRKVSAAYNVRLMMTGPHGNYLAGVPFKVSRHNDFLMVSGLSEGPLLYLKLPAGHFQIAVELDGAWQTRRVQAFGSGKATNAHFVAKGE